MVEFEEEAKFDIAQDRIHKEDSSIDKNSMYDKDTFQTNREMLQ